MESASTSNQELGSEEEKPTAYEIRDNTGECNIYLCLVIILLLKYHI